MSNSQSCGGVFDLVLNMHKPREADWTEIGEHEEKIRIKRVPPDVVTAVKTADLVTQNKSPELFTRGFS